jgi:NAD(P)H-hydrate epimerase
MEATPIYELPKLPRRAHSGHKGTYGKVLIVAGSRGMSGAAVLCGHAALRSGAGLVQVASPADVQPLVAGAYPAYTTFAIRQHADGSFAETVSAELLALARAADAVAIGPGLGRTASVIALVRELLAGLRDVPVVLDADGLFAVSPFDASWRESRLVLTPHAGEFSRLTSEPAPQTTGERVEQSLAFVRKFGTVLLLKGSGTLVTDGTRLYRNTTGNPGMATGGSGDVLTGVIVALLAQGLARFEAAALGAWVHGRAGDCAATVLGQTSLTSPDLVNSLPSVFRELESSHS